MFRKCPTSCARCSLKKRARRPAAGEGLVMDMPWKKIAPVNPNAEYLALLTYLPLKKHRAIPRFLWSTFAIQKQLAGSAGILGYALRAKPASCFKIANVDQRK